MAASIGITKPAFSSDMREIPTSDMLRFNSSAIRAMARATPPVPPMLAA